MARLLFINAGLDNATAAPNFQKPHVLTGVVNGTNKVFSFPYSPGYNFLLSIGGLIQRPGVGADYTLAGLVVTFTNAPDLAPIAYW